LLKHKKIAPTSPSIISFSNLKKKRRGREKREGKNSSKTIIFPLWGREKEGGRRGGRRKGKEK